MIDQSERVENTKAPRPSWGRGAERPAVPPQLGVSPIWGHASPQLGTGRMDRTYARYRGPLTGAKRLRLLSPCEAVRPAAPRPIRCRRTHRAPTYSRLSGAPFRHLLALILAFPLRNLRPILLLPPPAVKLLRARGCRQILSKPMPRAAEPTLACPPCPAGGQIRPLGSRPARSTSPRDVCPRA